VAQPWLILKMIPIAPFRLGINNGRGPKMLISLVRFRSKLALDD
jgi:hypothetical protein